MISSDPSRQPAVAATHAETFDRLFTQLAPKFVATLTIAGILLNLILRFAGHLPKGTSDIPLFVVLILGGVPLLVSLIRKVLAREFGSDQLAGFSIVTAVLLGEYLVAAIVILMLSGGTALEQFATRRASSVLDALARRMPQVAHRKFRDDLHDVKLPEITIGDILVVFPHEICPIDGVVTEGHSKMNEAYLTGEPFEIEKAPGAEVISGAINGDTALTIRASKLAVDSRYARIMKVMQDTEQRRPRLRRLGDRLGAWYTPLAVGLALVAWIATDEPRRFLAVLVVATPCPLLIGIPVAIIGAISLCARRGIIIKNPAVLEVIGRCRTLIFDKTGTLTYGKPTLAAVVCAPGFEQKEILRLAASLEIYSKHPLSQAIVEAARKANTPLESASEISEHPGQGLAGIVGGRHVLITGRPKVAHLVIVLPPIETGLECLVFVDGTYAGLFRFHDAPREESYRFIEHLSPRHRVTRILIVSGDRDREVRHLAKQVGIHDVYAAKTPEEKVEIVQAETKQGPTLFLGDGINDAPAMQAATAGVAFGAKSEITSEAADAVILETSLGRVDELIHISARMRRILLQTALGGMALSMGGMFIAAFGYLPPIGGAIAQEIIDLAAVLNAVRVAIPSGRLTDF